MEHLIITVAIDPVVTTLVVSYISTLFFVKMPAAVVPRSLNNCKGHWTSASNLLVRYGQLADKQYQPIARLIGTCSRGSVPRFSAYKIHGSPL